MEIVFYAIFAFVSWFLLMQIFRLSTYHKYFKYAVFYIVGYAVFDGYLLFYFDLHAFFLWHLPIFLALFYNNYKKQKKSGAAFLDMINEEMGMTKEFYELSLEKTLKYYILSALAYLIVFALSFICFYNR